MIVEFAIRVAWRVCLRGVRHHAVVASERSPAASIGVRADANLDNGVVAHEADHEGAHPQRGSSNQWPPSNSPDGKQCGHVVLRSASCSVWCRVERPDASVRAATAGAGLSTSLELLTASEGAFQVHDASVAKKEIASDRAPLFCRLELKRAAFPASATGCEQCCNEKSNSPMRCNASKAHGVFAETLIFERTKPFDLPVVVKRSPVTSRSTHPRIGASSDATRTLISRPEHVFGGILSVRVLAPE